MKWDRAIVQKDGEVDDFIASYLNRENRRCALICGAGFDPRTLTFVSKLPVTIRDRISALCLREERPKPQPKLRAIADKHANELKLLFPDCTISAIQIFDGGDGVIGGRTAIQLVDNFLRNADSKAPLTDVLVDISALSCGIFFPIFAHLLESVESRALPWNIHLFVEENPPVDTRIHGEITDAVSHIHGFRSHGSLSQSSEHASLWVPVLAENNEAQMRLIHGFVNQPEGPVDISPIVPFPGRDPRLPDILVEHYRDLIADWGADPRHMLFAAESDPLDSYRSICEIDELRKETFGQLGGSSTIVSPLGSKMLSVGLMLAAIERKLRAVYVECRGYDETGVAGEISLPDALPLITHLWLHGEIYRARP